MILHYLYPLGRINDWLKNMLLKCVSVSWGLGRTRASPHPVQAWAALVPGIGHLPGKIPGGSVGSWRPALMQNHWSRSWCGVLGYGRAQWGGERAVRAGGATRALTPIHIFTDLIHETSGRPLKCLFINIIRCNPRDSNPYCSLSTSLVYYY